jgi:hypothetical protein
MVYKVALLIPTTSKGRPWKSMKETYLYNYSMATFLQTLTKAYSYVIYVGYDHDDPLFSDDAQCAELCQLATDISNVTFNFTRYEDIPKGYLTKMWNILYKKAYDDGCNYFYQCGDDITFTKPHWVKESIHMLRRNNDIGIAGPLNNNGRILTQVMVSRAHMEIFGYFFPEEIVNWCCDDWYNFVYSPKHFFPLIGHFCNNGGGQPRYVINNDDNYMDNFAINTARLREETMALAKSHVVHIENYIKKRVKGGKK